jgi:hypothetical protein
MNNWLITLSLLTLLVSCSGKSFFTGKEVGQGIDISKDANLILLSLTTNGRIGIYEYNITDSTLSQLTKPGQAWHLRPKYAPNENSFLYLEYPYHDYKTCNLIVRKKSSKEKVVLLRGFENITEAVFSKDGQSIYFIQATSIGKLPNGNDLFRIDLSTKEVNKVTDYNSYSFSNLSVLNDSTMLANVDVMGKINLLNGKFEPLKIENDPRQKIASSHRIIDMNDSAIFYYAPYQVYKYDIRLKKCHLELDGRGKGHMYSIRLNDKWNTMIYTESSKLYKYSLVDKKIEEITLK